MAARRRARKTLPMAKEAQRLLTRSVFHPTASSTRRRMVKGLSYGSKPRPSATRARKQLRRRRFIRDARLDDFQIAALMRGGAAPGTDKVSMLRAMGFPIAARQYNPKGASMPAHSARQKQMSFGFGPRRGPKRAASGQFLPRKKRRKAAARRPRKGARKRSARRGKIAWYLTRGPGGKFRSRRKMPGFIRGRQRRATKKSKKHLRVIRSVAARHRVAGLLYRNPFAGGMVMPALVNPRRRRRNPHRRHHRRNPGGIGGALKSLGAAAIPAGAGGALAGVIDAYWSHGSMIKSIGTKAILAGLGGLVLRKNPVRAAAFIGSMIGTAAYEGGLRLGGGLVAHSKPAGIKELAAMAAEDEANLGLLAQELNGFGLLENEMSGLEPDLGDLEPDLGDELEGFGDEMTD